MNNLLPLVAHVVHLGAIVGLGLFAGAMLTEAGVLVPYWRSIDAKAFHAWYRANGQRLVAFFGAVTWLAGLSALASTVLAVVVDAPRTTGAAIAAGLMLTTVAMFPLYFRGANARFSTGLPSPADTADALRQWAAWHRVRTCISCLAFAVAAAWG